MDPATLATACRHLRAGGVIAYPTEAVWGLGCDPDNRKAVESVLALKQRPLEKGLILVAANIEQLGPLLDELSDSQREQLEASWPGPTTWLIPDPNDHFPRWIKGCHESVAIRVSNHSLVKALCKAYGKPIVSTSANVAGEKEIRSRLILERRFGHKLDYIVPGELGAAAQTSEIRDLVSGHKLR